MRIPPLAVAVALAVLPHGAATQQTVPRALSLEKAVEIARANNPGYLQVLNDADLADWDVRQAWGQLLPSASASSTVSWQGPGEQRFGSVTLGDLGFGDQPSYYISSYNVGVSYDLSWAQILEPRRADKQRSVAEAGIEEVESRFTAQVTIGYLDVLRLQEALATATQQLENAEFNLRLARGQLEVGQATPIDVGQAEVQVGRAQVAVLQAENDLETARMRLLQEMGVAVDQPVELTTVFPLTEPGWTVEDLYPLALRGNPGLQASRFNEEAAEIGVGQARAAYYPRLSFSTGWSGFTREASSVDAQIAQARAQVAQAVNSCVQTNDIYGRLADPLPPLDCSRLVFTDEQRNAIVARNDQFPFDFQRSPPSASLTVSVPIFQGLSRQRNLEAARIQRDDLRHQVRAEELALRADLAVELANVRTAYETALLEERNVELADQQLRLARDRYQLGAITFVDLVDAQTVLVQAERDRNNSVFLYHIAVTRLESLVGAPLRD